MASESLKDRVLGALLGGAFGDAWGRIYEGRQPPFEVEAVPHLTFTDDTQLTLATCESLLKRGAVEPADLAAHFLAWFRTGRLTGLGASTLKALRDLDAGAHWALAGARGERAAGCGAAMRVAPLACWLDPTDPAERTLLRDASRITHHHDEAYLGALAMSFALRRAIGFRPPELSPPSLGEIASQIPDSRVRDRLEELDRSVEDPSRQVLPSNSGAAFDTVPLALFAALRSPSASIPQVLRSVIALGGDTDTLAALTGQLLGARTGAARLLTSCGLNLEDFGEAASTFERFAQRVVAGSGSR